MPRAQLPRELILVGEGELLELPRELRGSFTGGKKVESDVHGSGSRGARPRVRKRKRALRLMSETRGTF